MDDIFNLEHFDLIFVTVEIKTFRFICTVKNSDLPSCLASFLYKEMPYFHLLASNVSLASLPSFAIK